MTLTPPPFDILIIRDMVLMMSVGIHDFEKEKEQRVIVNVEIGVAPHQGAQSDDINDVLSYSEIFNMIESIAHKQHIHLVETFAEQIAASALEFPQANYIRVRVEKPDIFVRAAGVGIEIFRQR